MLKARYNGRSLVVVGGVDVPDGASVILHVALTPSSGDLNALPVTEVRAVHHRGRFLLRQPLGVSRGSEVSIVDVATLRPLSYFRGMLAHLKEDGVALQHRAATLWGQRAP